MTYKWATPENKIVIHYAEGVQTSGLRSAFPDDITIEPADPIPPQPIIVTPRQIRQALTRFNLRTQVEAAIASGGQDLKDWWEFSTQVEENHPMVIAMAQALGVSDNDRKALFMGASAL